AKLIKYNLSLSPNLYLRLIGYKLHISGNPNNTSLLWRKVASNSQIKNKFMAQAHIWRKVAHHLPN
ncbi:MAG: hypothetical protein M3004_04170, partial [Bacteroidota bacterium]|nr:hypothetical protein [Bacteroidota bacterium]